MAYIGAEHAGDYERPACVFCDMVARHDDARTYIVHRGERAFVVMNLYPYNNGHLMIVPYAHVDSLRLLAEPDLLEVMTLAQRSQAVLEEAMRPQGFNLGMNQGRPAGAGIADHVHLHLVPRWIGDTNFMPVLGDVRVMPQHLDETYALLVDGFAE
jgi:ATP adenylyltransferase